MEDCLKIDPMRIKSSGDSYCMLGAMGVSKDWVKMEEKEQVKLSDTNFMSFGPESSLLVL